MKKTARYIVEDELNEDPNLDVEDAALDFVENDIGRFFFVHNWGRVPDKVGHARTWLSSHPEYSGVSPEAVVEYLDRLARLDTRWAR